jgi:hypothetical protein
VDNFALKFLLTLDRAIQEFLQKLLRLWEPDQAQGELQGYLEPKARAKLQDQEDNIPPRIIVPASLLKPAPKLSGGLGRDREDGGRSNKNRDKGGPKQARGKQDGR